MLKISNIEIGCFLCLFNRSGYVLNFSTNEFDVFTQGSIGVALCSHYGLSKGKSLMTYANEASKDNVIKLFDDLLSYYELYCKSELENEDDDSRRYGAYYEKCRSVMSRLKSGIMPFSVAGETLKDKFSSEYMSVQIDIMLKMQTENPTEAIGKSKELIESCCKTILEENNEDIDKSWDIGQLIKATIKFLRISANDVCVKKPEDEIIKKILGSLNGVVSGIVELRNIYGSGHGKSASYKGLTIRHAKLAVGSSITIVNYLWDAYEWRIRNKN